MLSTTGSGAEGAGLGDVAVTLPMVSRNSRSIFRCIPCDCHTTLVHSSILVFACSFSAGYFLMSLTCSVTASFLPEFPPLELGDSCVEVLQKQGMCAANAEADSQEKGARATVLHFAALILAFLTNNKWLKCTACPKTSFCAEAALCLFTLLSTSTAFISTLQEHSACFSCGLAPSEGSQGFDTYDGAEVPDIAASEAVGLLTLMRFESFLGVVTSLFLLIAVAWMVLGRVPKKHCRGHADLTDERASTIRHLLTSRVYVSLLIGLLFNIGVVIYYGAWLHKALALETATASARARAAAATTGSAGMATTSVQTMVPDGCSPGMDFTVEWGGTSYNITVPDGVTAGQLLTIELPALQQETAATHLTGGMQPVAAPDGGVSDQRVLLFGLIVLLYAQLAVCVLASAFNGWKHLQHWRAVTKVAPAQVAPAQAEGSLGEADGLDAEHSRLIHVGSKSLISASRLPAFMCSSLACGSFLIALVASTLITALYTWSSDDSVRKAAAPAVRSIGYTLAVLVSGVLSRMILVRCLFHAKQHEGGGNVLPMQRPVCFAWFEAYQLVFAIVEGIWIGAKRLVIAFAHATASLLRTDRPSYAEGRIVHDKVFRSYAAVLCLERDAEASRRQAGATHFDSGVLAVKSNVSAKHTALWCLGWVAALSTPGLIYVIIVGPPQQES